MSILKELMKLHDPTRELLEATAPVELAAVIQAFPKHHPEALRKLWGGQRLVWHGQPFFGDGKLGTAYEKAEAAAHAYMEDGQEGDADLTVELDEADVPDEDIPEDGLDDLHVEWKVSFDAEHVQECYLGYDPKADTLIIGFDAWAKDDDFNEAFDAAWVDMFGQQHDMDNEFHQKVYSEAWKIYGENKLGFWGLCYEIDSSGNAEECLPPMSNGFYKGVKPTLERQRPGIIDLRLD